MVSTTTASRAKRGRRRTLAAVIAAFTMFAVLLTPASIGAQDGDAADAGPAEAQPLAPPVTNDDYSVPEFLGDRFEQTVPEQQGTGGAGGSSTLQPLPAPPSVGCNFGLAQFSTTAGFIPPDTMGAVSPTHIVEMINGSYRVTDRTCPVAGGLLFASLDDFWTNPATAGLSFPIIGFTFDPRVVWDPDTGRFFAVVIDGAGVANNLWIAVSNTSNPLDGWTGFGVSTDNDGLQWGDFPMLGFDTDELFVSLNMFDIGTGAPFANNLFALDKADMIAGTPSGFAFYSTPSPSVWHPAVDTSGDSQIQLLAALGSGSVGIKTASSGSLSAVSTISVPAYSAPPDADQPGGKVNIDTGTNRFSSYPVEVGNSIWAVHTVNVGGRAGVRWYEFDKTSNTLLQSGTISHPTLAYFYPAIHTNGAGEVVIGFSGTDPNTFVSTYAAIGTTLNGVTTFGAPFMLAPGQSDYQRLDGIGRNRWGDYSTIQVDPSDPCRFWGFQEYVFATDDWGTNVFSIDGVGPPNDDLANAAAAPLGSSSTGNTTCATTEGGEPFTTKTVWFEFNSGAYSGPVSVDTCGSPYDTMLGVYTGSTIGGLTPLGQNDDSCGLQSQVGFTAAAGTSYKIQVGGFDGQVGDYVLNVTCPAPANDDLANAAGLAGASDTDSGNTTCATAEAGEPYHGGGGAIPDASKSVWYSWTAPASGSALADTCGSGFDTVLGVYTGSTIGGLTLVGQNDDANTGPCSGTLLSAVAFSAVSGTTYRIAVDGFGDPGDSGPYTVNINLAGGTTCNGLPVTVDLNLGQNPTAGDDVILGTPGNDVIFAGDGNDTVCAGNGEDFVVGGAGDDDIFGELGDDELSGNAGADLLDGGDGADSAFGGSGNDVVLGAGDGDTILGGGSDRDIVEGGPGNDRITGGSDSDFRVDGGVGDDTVVGGGGNDPLVLGGDGNDRVSGNGGKDIIFGEAGNDELFGGPNDDELYGGPGNDFLGGNTGIDICDGGADTDTAAGNCETIINVP